MIRPSKTNVRKAIQLGQKMARHQRNLRPVLKLAAEYPDYDEFASEHRQALQQSPLFLPWDEQIRQLVLREGKSQGIPMHKEMYWEAHGPDLVNVFYIAFWYGWEGILQLEKAHAFVLRRMEEIRAQAVPATPEAEQEQENFFEKAADTLFAAMDGDENDALWNMPTPDKPWAPDAAPRPK